MLTNYIMCNNHRHTIFSMHKVPISSCASSAWFFSTFLHIILFCLCRFLGSPAAHLNDADDSRRTPKSVRFFRQPMFCIKWKRDALTDIYNSLIYKKKLYGCSGLHNWTIVVAHSHHRASSSSSPDITDA